VGPKASLDTVEKRNLLPLLQIKPSFLGYPSLYQLSYHNSLPSEYRKICIRHQIKEMSCLFRAVVLPYLNTIPHSGSLPEASQIQQERTLQ
jgi:hypothetical protein